MYKERKDKVSIKFYVLIVLIILIIVFSIILLIPHKKNKPVKKVEQVLYSKYDMDDIKANYSSSFYDNFKQFKEASFKYFVKKVSTFSNEQIVTLDNFINDNHFLATLTDDDGNKCDEENSFVKYTKNSNNERYRVDITLVCDTDQASLKTYFGKYDYCEKDYCEKKIDKKSKPKKEIIPTEEIIPTPEDSEPTVVDNEYPLYEYVLTPNDSIGSWSEWSEWSTNQSDANLYKEIETKTESKTEEYDCSQPERYISGYKEEKYIAGYVTSSTAIGTKKDAYGNIVTVFETKTNPVYGTRKIPIYATRPGGGKKTCTKETGINYYRYRTFSYKTGINYIKYSSSDDDQYLISTGYIKTGKTK